jgi:hypothetical protein
VNHGFSSTLVVRNRDRQSSVSATPILFTSDQKQLRLPAIDLAPNSVERLSLEDALRAAGASVDSGALALEFDQPQPPSIIGEVAVSNYQQGIIFDLPLHAGYAGDEGKALHASWWLPDEETKGTVVLFNTSDKKVVVHPSLTANWTQQPGNDVSLAAHEVKTVDLRDLLHQSGMRDADVGSLTLAYDGPAHALLPSLLLFNEKTGFSLTGKFFPKRSQQAETSTVTDWRFPAVFAGSADPDMGFKKGMKLTPYCLMTNATNNSIAPQLQASFEVPGTGITQSIRLPVTPLAPMETRLVDLSEFTTKELISKDVAYFSLRVSHPGAAGNLAVDVFSTDHKGNFVFTAEGANSPSPIVDSVYWNVAGDLQSVVAVQNTGDREALVRVTLSYNLTGGGQGTYRLPLLRLAGQASRIVNLKQVITAGHPDESGQVIPAGVSFGTATVGVADGQAGVALVGGSVTFDPDAGKYGGFFLPTCSPSGITFLLDGIELPPCEEFVIIIVPVISICIVGCAPQGCGDERDTIIAEYPQYGVNFTPTCADFTQTAHSAHFSFAELNTGDYSWAIIRDSLLTGLENTRTSYNNQPMIVNSAYRNPARNNSVGGASQSRHMFGDAADIAAGNCDTWNRLAAAACGAGAWLEPVEQSGLGHVHMDWGHGFSQCRTCQ